MKLLEQNRGKKPFDVGFENDFFNMTPKAQANS